MRDRFLILGASGLVGGMVLNILLERGYDAVGASRNKHGSHWRNLDLLDCSTYGSALKSISTVMLISRPGDEEAHVHVEPFIAAMVAAGIKRVVVLSALGAAQRPELSNRKVELLVEKSSLNWTHVRPNFFMQMLARPPLSTEIARERTLSLPLGNAKIAYVDASDVAATLFTVLTDQKFAGQAIELSGPEALTHGEIVDRISRRIGETVRYIDLSEGSARALLQTRGFPGPHIERILRFYALCRQGFCATPDAAVAQLLGRSLRRFDTVIEENLPCWQQ